MYGLKDAPRLWNKVLKQLLHDLGMRPLQSDEQLYVWHDECSTGQPVAQSTGFPANTYRNCRGCVNNRILTDPEHTRVPGECKAAGVQAIEWDCPACQAHRGKGHKTHTRVPGECRAIETRTRYDEGRQPKGARVPANVEPTTTLRPGPPAPDSPEEAAADAHDADALEDPAGSRRSSEATPTLVHGLQPPLRPNHRREHDPRHYHNDDLRKTQTDIEAAAMPLSMTQNDQRDKDSESKESMPAHKPTKAPANGPPSTSGERCRAYTQAMKQLFDALYVDCTYVSGTMARNACERSSSMQGHPNRP